MPDINFLKQRIPIYAGKDIDPTADLQVKDMLLYLKIKSPQKSGLDSSLESYDSNHEISL